MHMYVCNIYVCRYVCTGVLQPSRYILGDAWDELKSNTRYQVEHNTWYRLSLVHDMRDYQLPLSPSVVGKKGYQVLPGTRSSRVPPQYPVQVVTGYQKVPGKRRYWVPGATR